MTNAQKLKAIRDLLYMLDCQDTGYDPHHCRTRILEVLNAKSPAKGRFTEQDQAYMLSVKLFNLIRKRRVNYKKPDLQKWSKEMDRLMRLDKRTGYEVDRVMRWAHQDNFWQDNILSPDKLRKQFDRLSMLMEKDTSFMSVEKLRERADVVSRGPTIREQLRSKHGKL